MEKKSQLSIFVIIGFMIIIINIYQVKKQEVMTQNPDNLEVLAPLRTYVEQCLRTTARDAIIKTGKGGRIYPSLYLEYRDGNIAYFYYRTAFFRKWNLLKVIFRHTLKKISSTAQRAFH